MVIYDTVESKRAPQEERGGCASSPEKPNAARAQAPPQRPPRQMSEVVRPAVGTLSRTKSLLLAALKVWELKNGIRD